MSQRFCYGLLVAVFIPMLLMGCKRGLGEECDKHDCCISDWCARGRCSTPEIITDVRKDKPSNEIFLCPTGQKRCNEHCIDVSRDNDHCGRCDNACDDPLRCVKGNCGCPGGGTVCDDKCVDLKTDSSHCGTCHRTCKAPLNCFAGSCAICPKGHSQCAGTCADLDSDTNHCGSCNQQCKAGATCQGGQCGCPQGQVVCGNTCADLQTSGKHCGQCANQCPTNGLCQNGTCQCGNAESVCLTPDGTSKLCVNLDVDNQHCGACNNKCGPNTTCNSKQCLCLNGATACGKDCAILAFDDKHCGQCGNSCQQGQRCLNGKCSCQQGLSACGAPPTATCHDLQTDQAHCGACNNACQAAEYCDAGSCVDPCNNRKCGLNQLGKSCGTCPQGEFCDTKGQCSANPVLLQQEIHIKPGTFTMGVPVGGGAATESPDHKVTITRDFACWKHEITIKEFASTMGYTPPNLPQCTGDCPVSQVNSHEAMALANALSQTLGSPRCFDCTGSQSQVRCAIKALYSGNKYFDCPGFRLPTEAEWEYAARAGTTTPTYAKLDDIAWYTDNAKGLLQPVETRQANAWGLYDMLGNVVEWVYDLGLRKYDPLAATDPLATQGQKRGVRGGHWQSTKDLTVTQRNEVDPDTADQQLGVRVCRTLH